MRRAIDLKKRPLILIVELETEERYRGWLDYRERMLWGARAAEVEVEAQPAEEAVSPALPPAGSAFIWRLISPTRRDVCGSAELFGDAEAAADDAQRLALVDLDPVLIGDEGYSWYLVSDGRPVVLAHSSYTERRTRDVAMRRAAEWLTGAQLITGAEATVRPDWQRLPMLGIAAERREGAAAVDPESLSA